MGEEKTKPVEFELGTFLWMVGPKALDYLMIRFNLDCLDT
jgi:hypothetical protein